MSTNACVDLVIRQARVVGDTGLRDFAFAAGRYVDLDGPSQTAGARVIDAKGKLAIPGFVEPHIHLDKALINEDVRVNKSGTLDEAIEIIWDRKRAYTVEDIVGRAGRVIRSAAANGVTRMRSHVDVDTIGGLRPLEGVLEARRRYAGLIDIQIVAFPQEGILKNPGAESLMRKAMEMGADVVGGMPFNEASPDDSRKHIQIAFDIAKEHDADVDMHVDETDDPRARTLEMLAQETIARNWHGRVTAGHTCALAAYPDDYAERVISLVKDAGINMIMNPATNLMLQGRLDEQPKRRGITRVKELLAAGVNVSFGQDCVKDTFYPFGRADSLEVALIAAHAAHMSLPGEIDQVFAMCTQNAAKLLRLKDYGMSPGCIGDLVLLDAETPAEAITAQPDRLYVIKRGTIVAETVRERRIHWQEQSGNHLSAAI
jgi:cytosine deaminase